MTVSLLLLAGSPATQAQSYGSPTYSGGSTSVACYDSLTSAPYSIGSWTAQATNMSQVYGYGGSGYTYAYSSRVGSTTCSGPVTVAFTWNGGATNALPPAGVIVQENCTAAWSLEFPEDGSGSCTSSFGAGSETQTGSTYSGEVVGVRYSYLANPGASFSLPLSGSAAIRPEATASATTPQDCAVAAAVSYNATASPVTLTGTIKDSAGNDNILVGQHCTASLSGIPGGTGWQTTYAWSISGTTFQSWSPTTPAIPPAPAILDASSYDPGPGPLTNPTASWYWNDLSANPTPEIVSCIATVTPPAGQGNTFTVTATQPVTVYRPIWTATGTGGYVKVNVFPGSSNIELWAGPTAAQAAGGLSGGMNFTATVTSPSPLFGAGSLELAQLVTPNLSYTTSSGNNYTYSEYGQQGSDGAYPYGWVRFVPTYQTWDLPGLGLVDNVVTSATLDIQYEDFLMYIAPSSTQPVPLARFVWDTDAHADIPTTGLWANYAAQNSGFDDAGTVTPHGTAKPFLDYNEFPEWKQINGGGSFGLFAPVNSATLGIKPVRH